jgi:hypothetical protein
MRRENTWMTNATYTNPRDVRDVRDPPLIGTHGVALPRYPILRGLRRGVGDRRAMALAAHDAADRLDTGRRVLCVDERVYQPVR